MFTWLCQVDGIRVLVALLIHAVLFCFVIFRIYVNFIC
ncbi:DNA repair protein RadC, partial [Bacillus cereus]